ncbi:TrkA C-terminal domain-containing protein, partial [Streptomyces xiaopingdaonensis]
SGAEPLWRDPSGRVELAEVAADPSWVGHRLSRLQERSGARIAFLTRLGEAMLPGPETVLQDGDLVHVLMRRGDVGRVEEVFAVGPGEERS